MDGSSGGVEAVEASDAGMILTRKNAIMQTIIAVVTGLGGFALALAPVGVLASLDPEPPDWVYGVALVWMFGCMLLNLGWLLCFALPDVSVHAATDAARL